MKAQFNLVRWILVVTLGCSLGLIAVFVLVALRPLSDDASGGNIYVRHQLQRPQLEFRLTEAEMEKDLRRVIEAQLAAFRQDDYPTAYKYAASGVKAQLPLPAFERMVRQMYPLIAQSSSVQFGVILDNGEEAMVNVTVVGTSGRSRHYQYFLQHEVSGWRIYGVAEVKPRGITI
ncbi:MAG: hypothetical protein JWQ04_1434 [Pedosphaera sp.]|nr:hypothetical protein [Pedosphaera sp.]